MSNHNHVGPFLINRYMHRKGQFGELVFYKIQNLSSYLKPHQLGFSLGNNRGEGGGFHLIKRRGGKKIGNLTSKNLALLSKWLWNFPEEQSFCSTQLFLAGMVDI